MTNLVLLLFAYLFQAAPGPTVTCAWRPAPALSAAAPTRSGHAYFTLALSHNHQEIENQYLPNHPLYTRVLQYLNYDIAQDVFLSVPGRPDSVAAVTVSYPRQYGSTGRSSVLLVFPVPDQQLRSGCHVTFRGDKLALGIRRFFFTAQDLKAAHKPPTTR